MGNITLTNMLDCFGVSGVFSGHSQTLNTIDQCTSVSVSLEHNKNDDEYRDFQVSWTDLSYRIEPESTIKQRLQKTMGLIDRTNHEDAFKLDEKSVTILNSIRGSFESSQLTAVLVQVVPVRHPC